jgi:hypothetical protein
MPLVQNIYRDKLLSNVSVKYTNKNFIADQVAPVIEVENKSGYFFTYSKENLRKPANTKRTGFSATAIVDHDLTQTAYGPLTERRLKQGITTDEFLMYSDPLDPRTDAAENVTEKMLLEREVDLAADMSNTAIVTNYQTLATTGQFSDYVTGISPMVTIQGKISEMKRLGLLTPNVGVMGQQVWDQLKNHPLIIDRIKYTSSASAQLETFAALVGLERIILGDAVQNTAAEGLTDVNAFIWGKHFWLMHVAARPGIKQVSAFYHLQLKGARFVDRWVDNDPPVEWVRVNDYYDRKLVSADAIYGLFNAVA